MNFCLLKKNNLVLLEESFKLQKETLNLQAENIKKEKKEINSNLQLLTALQGKFYTNIEFYRKNQSQNVEHRVNINVGGKKFTTVKGTLLHIPYFAMIFTSPMDKPNDDGEYFIDRNPKWFQFILDFSREIQVIDTIEWSKLSPYDRYLFKSDSHFYMIDSLINYIRTWGDTTPLMPAHYYKIEGRDIPYSDITKYDNTFSQLQKN